MILNHLKISIVRFMVNIISIINIRIAIDNILGFCLGHLGD